MINNRNTGPTPLPPSVLAAMAQQPLSHRSSAFRDAFSEVTAQLATLVNAPSPALLLTCSGTGGLEVSVASIVTHNSQVLVLSAGAYGDLLTRIASHVTTHLDVMSFTPGAAMLATEVHLKLTQKKYDVVLLTHSESSTGVYHPVAEITAIIRAHSDALILVDVVSSLGATKIDMAHWGADLLIGATQKSLMAPAGMAVVYLSERAQRHIEQHPANYTYMHLRHWLEYGRQNSVPYTPAVNVFQGLQASMKLIFAEGLDKCYQRHQEAAARCRSFFADHQAVRCFTQVEHASHSVTALLLADRFSASGVKESLESEHKVIVSTGLCEFSEQLIRVGHMGYFTLEEVDHAMLAISHVVNDKDT